MRRTGRKVAVVRVDITCDLVDEDETGYVWTFLREARDPGLIEGAIVVAGDEDAPAVAEVVDVVDKPAGQVVHLRVLPSVIEDCEAVVRRALTPA
jgi:coenzyme F420-reducing hydrogenase beta subunit